VQPFATIKSAQSMRTFGIAAAAIIILVAIIVVVGGTSSSPRSLAQKEEIRGAAERDARVDKLISENGPSALPPIPMPTYYTSTSEPPAETPTVVPTNDTASTPTSPEPLVTTETIDYQEFQRQRAASKSEAIALYPEVADHNAQLGREVDRLIESYKATDDPILYAPDAPMLITQVAARNLGVAQLRSGKVAASEAEELGWQKPLKRSTASQIEGVRLLKEAAQRIAEQERSRAQQQEHQIVPVPVQSETPFKLPSEIEADQKAARATQIAASKRYCEEHPIECETLSAAQRAQLNAEQTQRDLQALKTRLWSDGIGP
jgi:hypothetical protein